MPVKRVSTVTVPIDVRSVVAFESYPSHGAGVPAAVAADPVQCRRRRQIMPLSWGFWLERAKGIEPS
jgi:hypothetical protein